MMKRKPLLLVILFGLILFFFLALFLMLGGNSPIKKESMLFIRKYFHSEPRSAIELQGNVEVREVRLGFKVSGRISQMFAEEGDRVSTGQLLAKVESDYFEDTLRETKAALRVQKAILTKLMNGSRPEEIEKAKANTMAARVVFKNAQTEFLRAKKLLPSGAVSEEAFERAKAALDSAKAKLKAAEAAQKLIEIGPREEDIAEARALYEEACARLVEARRRLGDTKLSSPISGVIQTKVREVGDFVSIREPVYIVSITNPVWIRAYVNEVDLGKIRPGMKVIAKIDTGKSFKGQIGYISPVAEFTPKSVQTKELRTDLVYRIRIITQDPKNELRQGMPVSVFIYLKKKDKQ